MPVCPNCNEDNPERAKFCLSCGTPLAASPAPRETRKTVTVLFTDVTGSTALGERNDPEAMRAVMERYFDRMKAVISSHGGTVEKFIGDAIMAVFGVPEIHEDDALRAVRAAGEMREALGALNASLERERGVRIRVRTGVNTGQVVAGDPSAGQRLVTGDAVNVAARLEQAAQPDEILIGAETHRLVRGAVTVEQVDAIEAKGKAEPVAAYRLTGVTPGAAALMRRLDAPIVGRQHELSLLMQAFERSVRERACHLFTILGSAGVGKSRLVSEVLTALEDQATILRGRCLPYGDGITFFPLLEALPEAAGIRDDDSPAEARQKIAVLAAGEEHADRVTTAICELLDLAEGSTPIEEQFWAVRRLLEHLARRRPVVVEFDDIHWGEPKFLDLIEHIADWTRDAPILIICLTRHELLEKRPGWGGGKLNATSLNLEPLTQKECDRLVDFLLGEADIAEEARERITEAAEGNPLYVEEMLSMLIDDGALARVDGRWVAAADLSAIAVPPTIQALLSARIDRLTPDERGALECAAVAGKVFWRGAVAALSPPERAPSLDRHLLALVRKDLVRDDPSTFAGEDAFRFRHLLVRDTAYQGIAKRVRADLHERFALWLEAVTGERASEYEEIIAYHYEEAYRNLVDVGMKDERVTSLGIEAGTRLAETGRRATNRGDFPAAITLLRRAIAALPRAHSTHASLLPDLAHVLNDAGQFDEAEQIIEDAISLAEETNDESLAWRARIAAAGRGIWIAAPGSTVNARETASQAITVFERRNDEKGLARAWDLLSAADWLAQRAGDTAHALDRALEYSRRSGERASEFTMLNTLQMTLVLGPTPWPEAIERAERISRDHPSRGLEAAWLGFKGRGVAAAGRIDEGRALVREARSILADMGLRLWVAGYTQGAAAVELCAGNLEEAARFLREGADAFEEVGERAMRSTNVAELAEIFVDLERYDEAERCVEDARRTGDEHDAATQAEWRMALARLLALGGRTDEAEQLVRESLSFFEGSDFIEYHANRLVGASKVFARIGKTGEADAALRTAEDLYTAKASLALLERARKLRTALAL